MTKNENKKKYEFYHGAEEIREQTKSNYTMTSPLTFSRIIESTRYYCSFFYRKKPSKSCESHNWSLSSSDDIPYSQPTYRDKHSKTNNNSLRRTRREIFCRIRPWSSQQYHEHYRYLIYLLLIYSITFLQIDQNHHKMIVKGVEATALKSDSSNDHLNDGMNNNKDVQDDTSKLDDTIDENYDNQTKNDSQYNNDSDKNNVASSFMKWCDTVDGLYSALEIKDFVYKDYFSLWLSQNSINNDNNDDVQFDIKYNDLDSSGKVLDAKSSTTSSVFETNINHNVSSNNDDSKSKTSHSKKIDDEMTELHGKQYLDETKLIKIKGLAAKHSIQPQDVILSIPYSVLLTIPTSIDNDPLLKTIIGPKQRLEYKWKIQFMSDFNESYEDNDDGEYFEIPLLCIALLYHRSLGSSSPFKHYIELLLDVDVEFLPYLWHSDHSDLHDSTNDIHDEDAISTASKSRAKIHQNIDLISNNEIKKLSKQIQKDMRHMYKHVFQVLINDYPEIFGPPALSESSTTIVNTAADEVRKTKGVNDNISKDVEENLPEIDSRDSNVWFYSYEMFEWAFAIVNTRHFHLPILDSNHRSSDILSNTSDSSPTTPNSHKGSSTEDDKQIDSEQQSEIEEHQNDNEDRPGVSDSISRSSISNTIGHDISPPANQPTEEWIVSNEEKDDKIDSVYQQHVKSNTDKEKKTNTKISAENTNKRRDKDHRRHERAKLRKHSFLAPFADMINFGPSCSRAIFNPENNAFEIIATCSFQKGEEVTFHYSDDCEDVMIANYGFLHPIIPKCLTLEEWKYRSSMWREHALNLEDSLKDLYKTLDETLKELKSVRDNCKCINNSENIKNDSNQVDPNPIHRVDYDNNCGSACDDGVKSTVPQVEAEPKWPDHNKPTTEHRDEENMQGGNNGVRRIRQRYMDDLGL